MREPPKVHVATYGCRVNQADTEAVLSDLARAGMTSVALDEADVVVVNSCTVTHRSDADVHKLIARLQRENPRAKVVVGGCYGERAPEQLVRLGASAFGRTEERRVPELVEAALADDAPFVRRGSIDAIGPLAIPPLSRSTRRTRALLKIQDGCDARCTYCVIPSVRGPARSAPMDEALARIRAHVEAGDLEVVIAGVHLGTYAGLATLVRRALELPALARIRVSSIEPMAFPRELIEIARHDPRLARHFHVPIQSGSDEVLKRMNRPYRARELLALVAELRAQIPGVCVGTDVIVGFPGERAEDFERTLEIAEAFDHLHVFSYSDRPGVPSTRLRAKVLPREIAARSRALRAVARRRWSAHLARFIGEPLEVITLRSPAHRVRGMSSAFVEIDAPGAMPHNRLARIRALASDGERLSGELC